MFWKLDASMSTVEETVSAHISYTTLMERRGKSKEEAKVGTKVDSTKQDSVWYGTVSLIHT